MLNRKEITTIIILAIILAFVISLVETLELFLYVLLSVFLIFIINITAKKVVSFYLDTEIEIKLWEIKRVGLFYFIGLIPITTPHPSHKLKRPFPLGAFLPIIMKVLSVGYLNWMACFVFDVKSKIYKTAKRHGLYTFSEISEFHIGLIAAAGIFANLIFAIIGYFIGLPEQMNFITLSIWFAFFNILPISELDGNKIFFGNLTLWSFLASIVLIGLLYSILVI